MAASYEHGNEASGSIKGRQFVDQLNDYQLYKKVSAVWDLVHNYSLLFFLNFRHYEQIEF
jgi:hypothetical protein